MFTALKNNHSLTFYRSIPSIQIRSLSVSNIGGISSVAIANTSMATMSITRGFNAQLNNYWTDFDSLRANDAVKLNLDAPNQNARNTGVKRAWQYEKADIEMGGKGSANWDKNQRNEILNSDNHTVRGAEGHHQQNVSDHPEQQANPDNIKFYKTKDAHLQKGHGGDFHNESNSPKIDKNKMLENTNSRRVFKNEFRGLGIAAAIGCGVGITIGFAVTIAQSGITPESLRLAVIEGTRGGLEGGLLAIAGYGIGRTIGNVISSAATGLLGNLGVNITENILNMVNMGVVGSLTILTFSVYQFVKLKQQGIATREALIQVGKQALFSLSLLAVSMIAQGIWGGPAGIIVSVSIGIILVTYTVGQTVHQRHFAEKVRIYMIEQCRPKLAN